MHPAQIRTTRESIKEYPSPLHMHHQKVRAVWTEAISPAHGPAALQQPNIDNPGTPGND
jgi:hypothetical protein